MKREHFEGLEHPKYEHDWTRDQVEEFLQKIKDYFEESGAECVYIRFG